MYDCLPATDRSVRHHLAAAIGVGDETAGLADEDDSRSHVPGFDAALPIAVAAPRRAVTHVQRRGAEPAHIARIAHHLRELALKARVPGGAIERRNPAGDQCI